MKRVISFLSDLKLRHCLDIEVGEQHDMAMKKM